MASAGTIDQIIEAFLGNPFRADRPDAATLLEELDVAGALAGLLRDGNLETAKELLLSAGHAQACSGLDPAEVLGPAVLPRSLHGKLPRPRGDYLRIVMAAGRCYRALAEVRGASDALAQTRRSAWSACFGDSLRHTLDLEQVIRDHDVLLLGETGTGKELFAHAIQMAAPGGADGSPAPRAAINAAAVPDTLVESEIFGHVKGAFTGATEMRAGRLRSADGGTFFLDEVGDLPVTTQVKFLRVIETNEVYPVGSDTPQRVELRYVAATHKDLAGMVEAGEFRRDLYQRLAGNVLELPALRDRPEDILEIGRHFVRSYLAGARGRPARPERIERWLASREARTHRWPGNVRELQNVLRSLLLGLEPGLRDDAPALAPEAGEEAGAPGTHELPPPAIHDGRAPMQEVCDWYMDLVLSRTGGNLTQTARILGIDRSTVRRRTRGRASA